MLVRALRRTPGFTLVAISTLAIGLTVNIVMFSVMNAILRPELPYPDAARVLAVTEEFGEYGWTAVPISLATLRELTSGRSSAIRAAAP
jgi:putative ABC transport system permease protein